MKPFFLLFAFVFIFSSCATTGPSISSHEIQKQQAEFEKRAAAYRLAQAARVGAIAKRLMTYMPEEDRRRVEKLTYEIADDGNVNAYTDGRKIGITSGMLRFVESDDELAVIIAHELAHVARGHTGFVGKGLATNVLATAAALAAGVAVEATLGGGLGNTVADHLGRGIAGGFSREFEREADYFGYQYAYLAGFDILKGARVWERFAIELPRSMTAGFYATHPGTPERYLRAQKTLQELVEHGVKPNLFERPAGQTVSYAGLLAQAGTPASMRRLVPDEAPENRMEEKLKEAQADQALLEKKLESQRLELEKAEVGLTEEKEALLVQRERLERERQELLAAQKAAKGEVEELRRLQEQRRQYFEELAQSRKEDLIGQQELERTLLEAQEAAKQLRYEEFGVKEMGVARRVTNLWVGKKVSGQQRIFPLSQGSVDWFCQYHYWSANTWKALGMSHRKYRAYWYSPDGRLFQETDFEQSKVRAEFAKTTLTWDPALGDRLVGEWQMRVFENGKLLDERTFELVRATG